MLRRKIQEVKQYYRGKVKFTSATGFSSSIDNCYSTLINWLSLTERCAHKSLRHALCLHSTAVSQVWAIDHEMLFNNQTTLLLSCTIICIYILYIKIIYCWQEKSTHTYSNTLTLYIHQQITTMYSLTAYQWNDSDVTTSKLHA